MPTFISADYGSLDLQLRFIDMKYKLLTQNVYALWYVTLKYMWCVSARNRETVQPRKWNHHPSLPNVNTKWFEDSHSRDTIYYAFQVVLRRLCNYTPDPKENRVVLYYPQMHVCS